MYSQRKVPRTNSEINNFEHLVKAKIQESERRGRFRISTAYTRDNGFTDLYILQVQKPLLLGLHPLMKQSSPSRQTSPLHGKVQPLILREHSHTM